MWRKARIVMAGACAAAGVCVVPTAAGPATAATAEATAVTAKAAAPAEVKKPEVKKKDAPYCARYKCIALTFDDGPWPYTPALLDTLKKHKAKATFFLLGRKVAHRPELTRRIYEEGHDIGNHTWTHPSLTKLSDGEVFEEVSSTSDIINQTIGKMPEYMRPPNGATNSRIASLMADLGLPQILWTGSTLDWQARDTKVIAQRTLKLAKRNGVILLHDIVPETVKAMPGVLTALEKQHYKFVTLTTLLQGRKLRPGEVYPPRGK
ncbi:polysaccharide deacetylase family protein [Microbispora sp. KK1-11]|uniref:polysaccharide deacetylase family protein n=1 Tax=Microbispora sp. KK1-11 TaxID=2053005 RepID=UPI0011588512|nr:polysaccharide deacetylase family protein [Microbispora sp. KK1-11]TQS27250.1 polysaccharide deacetylase family protein [Microbispora sp. KK1-11]